METTRQQYANKVRFQIVPLLGSVPLRDLSGLHLRNWLTALARQEASASLRQHAHAVLKNALERAVRYGTKVAHGQLLPVDPGRPPAGGEGAVRG